MTAAFLAASAFVSGLCACAAAVAAQDGKPAGRMMAWAIANAWFAGWMLARVWEAGT